MAHAKAQRVGTGCCQQDWGAKAFGLLVVFHLLCPIGLPAAMTGATPLLDPAPDTSSGLILVVRFHAQVPAPSRTTRVKLIWTGFPESSQIEILSSRRLPQVLEVVREGNSWSWLLASLLPREEVKCIVRLQLVDFPDQIVAAAELNIAYAVESRPGSFDIIETVYMPMNFSVCNSSNTLTASLSAPEIAISNPASGSALRLVRYDFNLQMGHVGAGSVLHLLPLSAIHTNFGVAGGSECPLLSSQWDRLGVFLSWSALSCHFRQLASNYANAIEVDLGAPPGIASISVSVPSPHFGTFGTWLLMLSGPTCDAVAVAGPNLFAAPSGRFLFVSQADEVQVDVALQKNTDLPEDMLVSSANAILGCQILTTAWIPKGMASVSALMSNNVCTVTTLTGWLGPDIEIILRLRMQLGGGTVVVKAQMQTSEVATVGWSTLSTAPQLTSFLFPTGVAIQRPTVFLITFQTADQQTYLSGQPATREFPQVSQLRMKLLDASRWRLLRAQDGALLQEISDALAVDCAEYLRDFASASVVSPPRRCWGDSMRSDGDAVSVEWWPGNGLRSSTAYTLEVMAEFRSATTTADSLLELSIWSTDRNGAFNAREISQLRPTNAALLKSGSPSFFTQQPVINSVVAELKYVNSSSQPPIGRFRLLLQPGSDEKQWLRAGHALDFFLHPLSSWNLAATAGNVATCNSVSLTVSSGESNMVPPTCTTFLVGEAGVGFRQNAVTLVLGSNTLITPYSQASIDISLPLPSAGLFGASVTVACRYQAPAEEAAWHVFSSTLHWDPTVLSRFRPLAQGEPGQNLTLEMVFLPLVTLPSHSGASFRLVPPAEFLVLGTNLPMSDKPWVPLEKSELEFNTSWGVGVDMPLARNTMLLGGAEYSLRLIVRALAPSLGRRNVWYLSIGGGPAVPSQSANGQLAGVLITGSLSATLSSSAAHASAETWIAVYFAPFQTEGIFYSHLVLTAPFGYDFSGQGGGGNCMLEILLSLPAQSMCQSTNSGGHALHRNVVTVVLPPFTRLQPQEYGFAVRGVMPSFADGWMEEVEEASGHFRLETQSDEAVDNARLPGLDIFPYGCASGQVAVDGLVPGQAAVATLTFKPGHNHPNPFSPLLFLSITAPQGYNWVFPTAAFSAAATRSGVVLVLGSELLPTGLCFGFANVLCANTTFIMERDDEISISAGINVPAQNPDDPQGQGVSTPPFWHLKIALHSGYPMVPILPAARWMACGLSFPAPNRVRRIFAAAVQASNAVVSADNDISLFVETVTAIPVGGAVVIVAPLSVFTFPEVCLLDTPPLSPGVVGLPESVGAACLTDVQRLHIAAVILRLGSLSPSAYAIKILQVKNIKTISAEDAQYSWQIYTVAAGESSIPTHDTAGLSYLDSPRVFLSFAVTVAMQNAFIDEEQLDLATTGFTKQRGALNQVVICFQQALASVAGQILSVSIPEGFNLPWQDSSDCTQEDPTMGLAPLNISHPFGAGSPDSARFALFPEARVACARSPDGQTAYLTLSEPLVEITRLYAFRLMVRNANRSPLRNLWRLEFGAQASLPFQGFTLQAFQQLSISAPFVGASRETRDSRALLVANVPNVLEIRFQPSVPVPPGGALQLIPSQGFQLVPSVPRASRGVLLRSGARCAGISSAFVFIGLDYTFAQCEAACSQRGACEFFRFGIGDKSGECIQETSTDGSPPCQIFEADDAFTVYQITPTGNCFRFLLMEDGTSRNDVDCSLEEKQLSGVPGQEGSTDLNATTTLAVFGLSVTSPPLDITKVYTATIAIVNPSGVSGTSPWFLQSFSQTLLVDATLLEDGIADGFSLVPALDHLDIDVLPESDKHKAGMSINLSVLWAPNVQFAPLSDIVIVDLPPWLNITNACDSLISSVSTFGQCRLTGAQLQFHLGEALSTGQVMDFQFGASNPSAEVVKSLPRGELSLIKVSHVRTVVSAGETLLQSLATSAVKSSGSHCLWHGLSCSAVVLEFLENSA